MKSLCLGMLFAVMLLAPGAARAETLWQIGAPDNDYREMAIAGRYGDYNGRFPKDVAFRVGESSPGRDWPFIHPAPADVWAGSRTHPFAIEFDLPALPADACRLTLDLVNTHYASAPLLEVDLNGRRKYRFQLPTGGTDDSLTDPRAGKECVLPIPFPASLLQAGRNRITLTVVEGSWVLYDALWLDAGVPLPQTPVVATLSAACTPFFRRVGGEVRQAIQVTLNNTGMEGDAELRLSGARQAVEKATLVPGANRVTLLVDPFEKPEKLRLAVRAGGKESAADLEGRPERRWRVYVAPSAHTDIGYTDLQERVFVRHNENTLAALKACGADPGFKWNLEVAYQALLLRRQDPVAYQALMARAREGRLGIQGLSLNMLTGLCTGEELVQALSYGQRLAREHGLEVVSANLTDVPTSVGTLPTLLARSGIRYFTEGVNAYRGPVFSHADPRMRDPFWWEGPDGSRVLALLSGGYAQASGLGMVQSVDEVARRLPNWLKGYDRASYLPDALFVYGAFSDNCAIDTRYAAVAAAWNREWEYPKLILSRVDEFFRYVEESCGKALPVFRGDLGVYWEDGAASSARETATARWAKARLEEAERWHALAGGEGFPAEEIGSAWEEALFFDEHTWGAWCSISNPTHEQTLKQWEYKAAYATRAAEKAEALHHSGRDAVRALLTGGVRPPLSPPTSGGKGGAARPARPMLGGYGGPEGRTILAFNSESWERDVPVAVPVALGEGPVRVRDASSRRALPVQLSGDRLIFLAEGVPAMGYRTYLLERGEPRHEAPVLRAGADAWSWETPRLGLRIDPRTGALSSLEDRRLRWEWVDPASGYGVNQFLYVAGGEGTSLIQPGAPAPKIQPATHAEAKVAVVENGPVRGVLRVTRTGGGVAACDTYVVAYRDGRLDLVNVLHKQETVAKEAGYFAFPFRLRRPEATRAFVELPYGCVEAEKEQLPGACRDWYATPGFAAVSDGAVTALLAAHHAPLVTLGDLFRGEWKAKLELKNGTLFSYALSNYWDTNYKASQGGDLVFGYSLRLGKGAFDPAAAARFSRESASGMADPRAGGDPRVWDAAGVGVPCAALPKPARGSLLRVGSRDVLLGGLSREGERLQVRLYNPSPRPARTALSLPGRPITEAARTSLVGTPREEGVQPAGRRGVSTDVPARGLAALAARTAR